jgi:hypothetical protein
MTVTVVTPFSSSEDLAIADEVVTSAMIELRSVLTVKTKTQVDSLECSFSMSSNSNIDMDE